MLENPELRIEPLRAAAIGPLRVIRSNESLALLGHAVRMRGIYWWSSAGYAVCEEPDGSLLATVGKRWWLAPAVIADADGRAVATLRGVRLLRPDGRPIGEMIDDRRGGRCSGSAGADLADWTHDAVGTVLRFHPRIADEPLIKMAILGALLQMT